MTQHKLEIEEVRFGHIEGQPRVWYYCRCGKFKGTSYTLHTGPIYERFFAHLEGAISQGLHPRSDGTWGQADADLAH